MIVSGIFAGLSSTGAAEALPERDKQKNKLITVLETLNYIVHRLNQIVYLQFYKLNFILFILHILQCSVYSVYFTIENSTEVRMRIKRKNINIK